MRVGVGLTATVEKVERKVQEEFFENFNGVLKF